MLKVYAVSADPCFACEARGSRCEWLLASASIPNKAWYPLTGMQVPVNAVLERGGYVKL